MDEEISAPVETSPLTSGKSVDWVKVVLVVIVGLILLAASAYAGYWYGVKSAERRTQSAEPQLKTQNPETPTPKPEPTSPTASDPTANWKTCLNSNLNLIIKYPPSWSCVIDTEPRTGNYNIELTRPDGKKILFEDVYPFEPTGDSFQGERIEIAQIKLNNKDFKINFYPTRTNLPPLFEQIVYDSENLRMFYIVSHNIRELTPEDREELRLVFENMALLN